MLTPTLQTRYRTATRTAHNSPHTRVHCCTQEPETHTTIGARSRAGGRRMQISTPPPAPRGCLCTFLRERSDQPARATHMHSQAPMCSRHTHLPPLYSNTHLTREVDGVQYLPSHPRKARHPTPHSHRGEDEWASWKGRPSQSEARTSEE